MERINLSDQENTRLLGIIANALTALDEHRLGDVRRILKTGSDNAVKAVSSVLARNSG